MKQILIIGLVFLALLSCKDDMDDGQQVIIPTLDLSEDTLLLGREKSSMKITVNTNSEYWEVEVPEEAPWCQYSTNMVPGASYLMLKVNQNDGADERNTVVKVFGDGDIQKTILVRQSGSAPLIMLSPRDSFVDCSADSSVFQVKIKANFDFDIQIGDTGSWIHPAGRDEVDSLIHFFGLSRNMNNFVRSDSIVLKQRGGEYHKTIFVSQKAGQGEYNPGNVADVDASLIKVEIISVTGENAMDGNPVGYTIDGNPATFWHSRYANNAHVGSWPVHLEYTLNANTEKLDYIIYTPRGGNGNFKTGKVMYTTKEGGKDTYMDGPSFDFGGSGSASTIRFPETIKNPRKVKFVINEGSGGFASCAEMEFYYVEPMPLALEQIFTDLTYSELKEGVVYANIISLEKEYPFYFNLAKALFDQQYPLGRIIDCAPYQLSYKVAEELKTSACSQLDNMTGIAVKDKEEILIFVGPTYGEQLSLCVINYDWGYRPMYYPLVEGANKLIMKGFDVKDGDATVYMPGSGLAYIIYQTDNHMTAKDIRVHLASGGEINGYFDLEKHSDSDWRELLRNAKHPYMDVKGVRSHLCYPVKDFLQYVPGGIIALTRNYDRLVELEHELLGLELFPNRHLKNRTCFVIDPKTDNPNASDLRTVYPTGSMKSCCLFTDPWGPAHELGHMLQTRPGLKWHGTTEVTNNIMSQHVLVEMGGGSRLAEDNRNFYEGGFTKIIAGELAHLADTIPTLKHFQKLVPFWQLYLYSREVSDSKRDFYPRIYEQFRKDPDLSAFGASQLNFVKVCCKELDMDLTDFFVSWGFLRPIDMDVDDYGKKRVTITIAEIEAVKRDIAAMGLEKAPGGLCYLHDNVVGVFKNKAAMLPGKARWGTKQEENKPAQTKGYKVTVTASENVIAFEAYLNGKLVMASNKKEFLVDVKDTEVANVVLKAVAWDGARSELMKW